MLGMTVDALRVAMAAHHDSRGTWEEFQTEGTEVPSPIVEVEQYLKMHVDGPHGRPVVPVHGSSQHRSWPESSVLAEVEMASVHWRQCVGGAS